MKVAECKAAAPLVNDLHYTPAGPAEAATGLLGFVQCTFADTLVLDGIALRQTLTGRLALSFPMRRDRAGNPHPYVRPLNDPARREIEGQVFKALSLVVESAS